MNLTEAQQLRQEIVRLKQALAIRPVRVPTRGGSAVKKVYVLQVLNGNLIRTIGATNYHGLKYPAADVTTIISAVPANTAVTCPDGVSPAMLISDTGTQTLTWIGTRLKPGTDPAIIEASGSFYVGTMVLCRTIVAMPVAGSSPTTYGNVYVPWRI